MGVLDKLNAAGPKRVLSCDGGGIRGLMTVEILDKLEADLRAHYKNENVLLSDYFDFVCGTSTGAIIAACISAGMSMQKIRQFYIASGSQMFDKAFILKRLRYFYNDEPLAKLLQKEFNKALGYKDSAPFAKLGDKNLKTLLMMVMRNHTTDSPWPISNNPRAKYNEINRQDCNLNLPLWQLVRASTAAPLYFPPEQVVFGEGTDKEYGFVFVDGGVTSYNNPAFLAYQMVTASPYKINWKSGKENLLIVSVGTGNAAATNNDLDDRDWLVDHATRTPTAIMNGASAGWDMTCRTLGFCTFGDEVDREFGSMISTNDQENWTGNKLFTYVRYNPETSQKGLDELGLNDIEERNVKKLDSTDFIAHIQKVGKVYADRYVDLKHIEEFI